MFSFGNFEIAIAVGFACAGYAAHWWQTRTKTDGKDTPVLDGLADAVARLQDLLNQAKGAPDGGAVIVPAPTPTVDPMQGELLKLLTSAIDHFKALTPPPNKPADAPNVPKVA